MIINKKSKKSQITMFVIIAVIIVLIVASLVAFRTQLGIAGISASENPVGFIEQCLADYSSTAVDKLMLTGGLNGDARRYAFADENITYLCYTENDNELCVNEHPMLNKEIGLSIKNLLMPKIESCFNDLQKKLSGAKYSSEPISSVEVSIEPTSIIITLNKKISYIKTDTVFSLDKFSVSINSPACSFIGIANDIVNQELDCACGISSCNADIVALSTLNREFETSKPVLASSGEEVYQISELSSTKKFKFALRNCVIETQTL